MSDDYLIDHVEPCCPEKDAEIVRLREELSEAVDALYRIDSNADFCSCIPCRENSVIASEAVARYDGEVSD